VLEQRVFRAGLWKNDYQFVWIRWFMDYPDPHNEYFDTFYGKKTEGKRQAWVNDAFDKELEAGRDTRDLKKRLGNYAKAEEIMQTDGGYIPVAWVARWAAAKPTVRGLEKNKQGETVVDGNIYFDMFPHMYMVEKAYPGADINVATWFPKLFEHLPVKVFGIDDFKPEFDTPYYVIDTLVPPEHPSWKYMSANLMHATDFMSQIALRAILPDDRKQIRLSVKEEDVQEARDVVGDDLRNVVKPKPISETASANR
jgi:hypothetical protein